MARTATGSIQEMALVLLLQSQVGLKSAPTTSLMNCLRRLFSILTAWDTSTMPSLWICSHRKPAAQKIPLRLAPSLWRRARGASFALGSGGRPEPQRCPPRAPHTQDDLGHRSHTQPASSGKPFSLNTSQFHTSTQDGTVTDFPDTAMPSSVPWLLLQENHPPAGDKDMSILALPMVCLHLPQQADDGVRVWGKTLLHGPVCQLM